MGICRRYVILSSIDTSYAIVSIVFSPCKNICDSLTIRTLNCRNTFIILRETDSSTTVVLVVDLILILNCLVNGAVVNFVVLISDIAVLESIYVVINNLRH